MCLRRFTGSEMGYSCLSVQCLSYFNFNVLSANCTDENTFIKYTCLLMDCFFYYYLIKKSPNASSVHRKEMYLYCNKVINIVILRNI